MLRGPLAAVALVAILGTALGACGEDSPGGNEAGPCPIEPRTVCRDMDLRGVSMVAADLTGADFSGSDLRGADLREVTLDDATLVGANLGDVDFTDASLKNADLSKTYLFGSNLTGADMTGAITTDAFICNITATNGGIEPGNCASDPNTPTTSAPGTPTGPPVIESFTVSPPGKCLNDAAGEAIEVDYVTRNTSGVVFFVDNIRIDGESKLKGMKRLPFVCDGKPHVVELQAFGVNGRVQERTLTATLQPAAPLGTGG